MPNALAYAALVLWPVVSLVLFRRLPVGRAIIASLLVAYLFLPPPPTQFDFPLLPALNKETTPSVVAFLLCLILYRGTLDIIPKSPVIRALLVLYVISPLLTVLTNPEPVFYGTFGLPGLRLREAVGMIVLQAILILPFLLARSYLRTDADLRDLLLALLIGGLAYSVPMLLEVRLSPQINIWVYGYFQHDFSQMMRFGGFRPIVFLYHGLWVAFFTLTALMASVALMRGENGRQVVAFGVAAIYLVGVLILCKSIASLIYALALVPLILLCGQRMQLHAALLLALIALAYPAAKGLDLVPRDALVQVAADVDPDRAASLQFRFNNETILLDRASQKPLFGWGMWGRNHMLDETSGEIRTVTDGRWIILIGVFGWLGFLAEFGLLAVPIILMWYRHQGQTAPISPYVGPVCLILAINIIDLIPNATITPLTWLFAGAILGYAELHVPQMLRPVPAFRTVL